MENKVLSKKDLAESFSTGKFEVTFPHMSENVSWRLVGDKELNGKSEVVSVCSKSTNSTDLVQKISTTKALIEDSNKVVINGSGEFIRDGKKVNLIANCDVFEFNENDQIESISSYGIAEKQYV